MLDKVVDTDSSASLDDKRSLERALGHKVRMIRRERGLSTYDLATAAGISRGMVSKIENGQISPSLGTVNALAEALGVPMTSLFSVFEDSRDCSHVKKGQGSILERRGTKAGHLYELLGSAVRSDVVVEPYLITLDADAEAYTNFQHGGVEFIYVLTGEVMYQHGRNCYHLQPGDSLLFDSAAFHGPAKLLSTKVTFLSIISYPRD